MNKLNTSILSITIGLLFFSGNKSDGPKPNIYLQTVETFADRLLEVGTDKFGSQNTAMWASVIDLKDLSVPPRNVPTVEGVRSYDRAVGGSNYYHDVMTMKVFEALSEIKGNAKYADAVKAYSNDFLARTQNPETGLLGWGEHLYYDFYRDTVAIAESRIFDQREYFKMPHELIAWTPPWERLWNTDPDRTAKAIEGIMWHFNGPDTKTYLFNRHAAWNKPERQIDIMPWIKHTVLFAYSFAFIHEKTGDEIWKKRAKDIAYLYWRNRDYDTDLVFNCFYHSQIVVHAKLPGIGATGNYAYWMYKTAEILGDEEMKGVAKELLLAYDTYGSNAENGFHYNYLNLDGTPLPEAEKALVWKSEYGTSSIFSYGRAVALIAKNNTDKQLLDLAIKCEKQVPGNQMPKQYTAENIGEAINFYIDLFELTNKDYYLKEAKKYADKGIANFVKNGLLARQTNDRYYEAKIGVGDLLTGFFRLGMIEDGKQKQLQQFDLSY